MHEVQTKEITTTVTKEAYELGLAGGKFMEVISRSLQNGWEWTDVIDIVKGTYTEAKVALDGAGFIDDEFKAEPFKASLGIVVPVMEGAESMRINLAKKEDEAVEVATPVAVEVEK